LINAVLSGNGKYNITITTFTSTI